MGKPKQISKKDLVSSAKVQLLQHGQGKVTMKGVAQASGVTQGVVYYHFKSKEQLLLALLNDFQDHAIAKRQEQPRTRSRLSRMVAYLTEESYKSQISAEDHQLFFELVTLSLHHKSLRPVMGKLIEQKVEHAADLADGDRRLGRFLAAISDGLALHSLIDPTFRREEAYTFLKDVLRVLSTEDSKKE